MSKMNLKVVNRPVVSPRFDITDKIVVSLASSSKVGKHSEGVE